MSAWVAAQHKGPTADGDGCAREVARLHERILAPPREGDAAVEGLPVAAGAAQVAEAGVLLGELGSEVGDVEELLVGAGALSLVRLARVHAHSGDEVRLRRANAYRLCAGAGWRSITGASVMKDPCTTSLPPCSRNVASSVLMLSEMPGDGKKL